MNDPSPLGWIGGPLIEQLRTWLAHSERAWLAPGYLFLPGLFELARDLQARHEVRLLISNPTHAETLEQIAQRCHRLEPLREAAEARRYLARPEASRIASATAMGFRRGLELTEQTLSNQGAGRHILALIEQNRLAVRVHVNGSLGPHAYLFDGTAHDRYGAIGSVNVFLPQGVEPAEFSQLLRGVQCEALGSWFDRVWGAAFEVSDLLAEEIRQSWIGSLVTPYDLYMKVLYMLVRERVEFDTGEPLLTDVTDRLADFQLVAFRQAIRIIRDYGGVFVADVVGLGKSFIGAAVVKYFERTEHARPLIICPAPLVEMWERYNEAHHLNAQVLSSGLLRRGPGGENPLLEDFRYRERDFVLIDESHAFRSPGTQRYQLLREFMERGRRRACLLTATPRNRSARDVYHQIKLFHPEDRTHLPISPPHLGDYFREVERGGRALPSLLSHLLIRRTRSHVLRFYGFDAETGRRVDSAHFDLYRRGERRAYVMVGGKRQFFPRRELVTVEYSIERTYQGLYAQIRERLTPGSPGRIPDPVQDGLTFARYQLWEYVRLEFRASEPFARLRGSSAGLHALVRVLLFKRFESSIEAFRASVRRMIQVHRRFLNALNEGIVPAGDEAIEILSQLEGAEDDELLEALRELDGRYDAGGFDLARLGRDVSHDLAILEDTLRLVEPIIADQDEKLVVLRQLLASPPLKTGKRLIFTQFADTARYLYEHVRHTAGPNAAVEVMLSSRRDKGAAVGRFAPRANPEDAPSQPGDEIATLVTTDVMSEGLNLQDCDKIINYDLHWNPVRLIQRFGRIDRIGSEHERIFGFNFLPELGLEQNLGLRRILRERIREIHETIGEDSSILEADERLNEQAMYAMYEADGDHLALFEEEPDTGAVSLSEAEEVLRQLRENEPEEYDRIARLPDGIRSARRFAAQGLFVFSRAGSFSDLRLVDGAGRLVCEDLPQLLGALKCGKDTPTEPFPPDLVAVLLRTQQRFIQMSAEQRTGRDHFQHLTQGQRYVLRELRQLASAADDPALHARIDQLERAYRCPVTQAVNRELNRLRREGTHGEALLRALAAVYYTYGLRDRMEDTQRPGMVDELPVLVCSEAFVGAADTIPSSLRGRRSGVDTAGR